ncbi:MAG: hypothetical protein LBN21_00445 [Treponema sp.]|nr:hypothetical protein [Treponema sp.]
MEPLISGINPEIPIEQHSYLKTKEGITIEKVGTNGSNGVINPAGVYEIQIRYQKTFLTTDIAALTCTLEEGKYYFIDYELTDTIRLFVSEITDPAEISEIANAITRAKTFLAWSKENPKILEGVWKTNDEKYQLMFDRDYFKYHKNPDIEYAGTFWYNEDTIIVHLEWTLLNSIQSSDEVLYYKLNDGVLDILDGDTTTFGSMFKIINQYTK